MKKIVEVEYQCEICKLTYNTKREALKCELGKNEPREFSGGDFITTNVKLVGGNGPVNHYCRGRIIKYKLRHGDPMRAMPPAKPQEKKYSHIWEYDFKCDRDGHNCSAFQCDLEPVKKPNR